MRCVTDVDLRRVVGFLEDAVAVDCDEAFPPEVLAELRRLVRCDTVSFSELDRVREVELEGSGSPGSLSPDPHAPYWQIRHAEMLWLSPGTVRRHLQNVYEALDIHNRTSAVGALPAARRAARVALAAPGRAREVSPAHTVGRGDRDGRAGNRCRTTTPRSCRASRTRRSCYGCRASS